MGDEKSKRPRGRPPKEGNDEEVKLQVPKHHYDYLNYLVVRQNRLGKTVNEAALHILVRELDRMEQTGYHKKAFPED